jgi:hypothetical protein
MLPVWTDHEYGAVPPDRIAGLHVRGCPTRPAASAFAVSSRGAGRTVRIRGTTTVCGAGELASVTAGVNGKTPLTAGVPPIRPVTGSMLSPSGRAPSATVTAGVTSATPCWATGSVGGITTSSGTLKPIVSEPPPLLTPLDVSAKSPAEVCNAPEPPPPAPQPLTLPRVPPPPAYPDPPPHYPAGCTSTINTGTTPQSEPHPSAGSKTTRQDSTNSTLLCCAWRY